MKNEDECSANKVNNDDFDISLFGDISDVDDPTYVPEDTVLQHISVDVEKADTSENRAIAVEDLVNKESKSRKRTRNPSMWKQNVRKKKRENGQEYVDIRGKEHPAKFVKGSCNCRMKCYQKINDIDQAQIHTTFWSLTDNEKSHFYSKFVERYKKKRYRPRHLPAQNDENAYKQYSFNYYFELNGEKVKVCKAYFLQTLNISSRRISYFFSAKYNINTGTPKIAKKGKHIKKVTSEDKKEAVRAHINSFPRIDSHYCRATTAKQYLEPGLSLQKMYNLYREKYAENSVKICMYRKIFNTEFNIEFHKPKKDRCDFCEEMKNITSKTEINQIKYEEHLQRKTECREAKKSDKEKQDKELAVISFDLQQVFALPKANISNFFYKRKLSAFNLTAHCSVNGKTYCAIWHEMICGRAGIHIASALIRILNRIICDIPQMKRIILWSDSCVAQNKNSIMSFALLDFLRNHPTIESVEQKFSEPGHGNVQEVDNVHSLIEKQLRFSEIFSPVSLLRCLKTLSGPNGKLVIIQLKKEDFLDFQNISKTFSYNMIPYTKIKYILLKSDTPCYASYKHTLSGELHTVRVARNIRNKSQNLPAYHINSVTIIPKMSSEKQRDLKSMYKYMPEVDRVFYNCILK